MYFLAHPARTILLAPPIRSGTRWLICLWATILLAGSPGAAPERFITLASTTSTEQSGLFEHILPVFTQQSGISVHVVAVGTGQALAIAGRGDADALLVHDREGEENFMAAGDGLDRREVMFNDFVLIGPKQDPAGVRGLGSAEEALRRIAAARAHFASRGDDSGTNREELRIWRAIAIDPHQLGSAYRELGQGMGPTLNTAAVLNAYTLSDRATWLNFHNRQDLEILVQGDPMLRNVYASILVNPAKFARVKFADARVWHDWLTSDLGQWAIAAYGINGVQLFHPLRLKAGAQ